MTNEKHNIKNLTLAALCLAIALLLPFLTAQIQTIGNMLCPMHIPIFCVPIFAAGNGLRQWDLLNLCSDTSCSACRRLCLQDGLWHLNF